MARIYVSSTYDLKEHREQVYRALPELGHDVVAMEDYVASDQRPLATCLADVASCDLYVGIFAHRYSYVPDHDNPDRQSITELEYRYAETRGALLCLVNARHVETEPQAKSQIAKASSSNATASRRFTGSSTANS